MGNILGLMAQKETYSAAAMMDKEEDSALLELQREVDNLHSQLDAAMTEKAELSKKLAAKTCINVKSCLSKDEIIEAYTKMFYAGKYDRVEVDEAAETALAERLRRTKDEIMDNGGIQYEIMDNGGVQHLAFMNESSAIVYARDYDNNDEFSVCIGAFHDIKKGFVGEATSCGYNGNSILIQMDDHNYTYVGSKFYSFRCEEQILSYYSPVGNSGVPYPVAMTDTQALFMLDRIQVPKTNLEGYVNKYLKGNWTNIYEAFYSQGHENNSHALRF